MSRHAALDRALAALVATPGPGGAVAVLREGEVLTRHAWGWADMERRLPFTPATLFRICSISKQFTCATWLDTCPDPATLDGAVAAAMPHLHGPRPTTAQLAHNQSGLRDYWATAMLCGAPVEGVFGPEDARRLVALTRSLHFTPGTRYSYCNQNFRLIGEALETHAGRPLAELLRTAIFARAGMETAQLCPETSALPDGATGYEGSLEEGWRAAVNRIHWTGDAGIAASLDDMIAWEHFIDTTRDDPDSPHARLARPTHFTDGTEAGYGFGLARMTLLGHPAFGHGGGLRGWRSVRFYLPGPRISVVALFNHMADPRAAALSLLGALLGTPTPATPPPADSDFAGTWAGTWFDDETGLVARIEPAGPRLALHYGHGRDTLETQPDGSLRGDGVHLTRTPTGLAMHRAKENLSATLIRPDATVRTDCEGLFHSPEYDATLTCHRAGGALYATFSGQLGNGMMVPLLPAGTDLWRLPMPRALDFGAPGDWTLHMRRDSSGKVNGVRVGCWLARGIEFGRK